MNIFDALKKDHDKVKGLLADLVSRAERGDEVKGVLDQIADELIPHARAEEAVFYNPLREIESVKGEAMHGYKEHAEAETLLRSLQMMDKVNADTAKLANKLKDAVEHHIQEEEADIFSSARKVLLEGEAEQMAEAFERLKPEIREEGVLQQSLDLIANIMPGRFGKSVRGFDLNANR